MLGFLITYIVKQLLNFVKCLFIYECIQDASQVGKIKNTIFNLGFSLIPSFY